MTDKMIDISIMDFMTNHMKKYQCFQHNFTTYDQRKLEEHYNRMTHYVTDTIQCDVCSQFVKVKTPLPTLTQTRAIQTTCDRCKNLNIGKIFK